MKKLAHKNNLDEATNINSLDGITVVDEVLSDDQHQDQSTNHTHSVSQNQSASHITPHSPPPEGLNGLIDPEKPTDPDTVHAADLMIARNLRQLEIHRYEIATALENLSDEEVGEFLVNEEDEAELLNVDLAYANHIQELKKNRNKKKSLDPDQYLYQFFDHITQGVKRSTSNMGQQLRFNNLIKMNQSLCLRWHQWRYDQTIEKRLFIPFNTIKPTNEPTKKKEAQGPLLETQTYLELQKSTITPSANSIATPMPCAPVALVQWSLECLAHYQEGNSFRHFYFIDPACGHGRTLLMASQKDFRAILGIENRDTLSEKAVMNIAQYPKSFMVQREIKLNAATGLAQQWPNHPLLIHIFQPESKAWLAALLNSLNASFYQSPRQIYIVMIDNPYKDALETVSFLHPFNPSTLAIEKKSYLNPYEVEFYYSKINQ